MTELNPEALEKAAEALCKETNDVGSGINWNVWPETPRQASIMQENYSRQEFREQAVVAIRAYLSALPAEQKLDDGRECTCHPSERFNPCQRRFAYAECEAAFKAQIMPTIAEQKREGWTPIESAPRDGHGHHAERDIDLWHKRQGRVANCYWREEYKAWFARSGGRGFNMGDDKNFTHWMPLPVAPEPKP